MFRTSISDYNFQVEVSAEQDRIVKTTFSVMVYAYLLPDRYENYKAVVKKAFTTRKIVFNVEATGKTIQEAEYEVARLTELNGNKVPVIDEKVVYQEPDVPATDWVNREVLDYQSFLITKTGSLVTTGSSSGSAIFSFASTSFNTTGTTSNYQKFMLFIDDRTVNIQALTYYTTGSSLIVNVVNSISGVTPTTSSLIIGYGNII